MWWFLLIPVAFVLVGVLTWLLNKPRRDLLKYILENREIVSAENGVITTKDGQKWRV